jgi:hypothetical protein
MPSIRFEAGNERTPATDERVKHGVSDVTKQFYAPPRQFDREGGWMPNFLFAFAIEIPHPIGPFHEFLPCDIGLPAAALFPILFVKDNDNLNGCNDIWGRCRKP